jgi:hypothetical protein
MRISALIKQRKNELKSANPKSRDRIRHKLKALQKVELMRRQEKKQGRAA